MYKSIILFFGLFLLGSFVFLSKAEARSGCCSHHGGVCGCGCCDGTGLSATCAPYYPECNKPVCKPSCACASKTCSGKTCSNGCGGSCKGTKNCTPPTSAPAPKPAPKPEPEPVTAPSTEPTTAPSNSEEDNSNQDQQNENKEDIKGATTDKNTTQKADPSSTACSSVFIIGGVGVVAKLRRRFRI